MIEEDKSSREHEELKLLYSSCVSEIISFKQQQWHVTNYALLLYVAVFSMSKFLKLDQSLQIIILSFVAFVVLVASWFVIGMLSNSIQKRRNRLIQCRKEFSKKFILAWGGGRPLDEIQDKIEDKPSLRWFFVGILALGFSAVLLLLHLQ